MFAAVSADAFGGWPTFVHGLDYVRVRPFARVLLPAHVVQARCPLQQGRAHGELFDLNLERDNRHQVVASTKWQVPNAAAFSMLRLRCSAETRSGRTALVNGGPSRR